MKSALFHLTLLFCTAALPLRAQESAPAPSTASAEVTALQENVLAALNAAAFDKLLPLLTPDVTLTFQNAEEARGRAGVKTFLEQKTNGPEALVQSFKITAKAGHAPTLYGADTAVLAGSAAQSLRMANGKQLELAGRWTATAVRTDGQWQLAALHTSTNLFSSPLIDSTKRAGRNASIASLFIGLFVGWMLGRKRVF